jgi:uncharacterized protein YecA (UPF0149 family)
MTFDFSVEGQVKVTQEGYVSELVASEDLRTPVKTPAGEMKAGRNDACPCGSGKKFKKCHGA